MKKLSKRKYDIVMAVNTQQTQNFADMKQMKDNIIETHNSQKLEDDRTLQIITISIYQNNDLISYQ